MNETLLTTHGVLNMWDGVIWVLIKFIDDQC